MAYVAPYVDDSGLHIPTYVDIRDDLVRQFKEIYGEELYLENDSQDYQMISAFASKTYDTMQLLQIVYNNHSPKTAVGTGLSSVVKLNGIARKAASYSTCVLTLTGTFGTVIQAGKAQDSAGKLWDLPANTTFTSTTIQIAAQCEEIGAIEALPGTINKIYTPQQGWLTVNNDVAAVLGQPVETDLELRERQSVSVALPSRNMLEGTAAAIMALEEVTRSRVYDNDTSVTDENGIPSHSIAAVVEGGLDEDIARAIYLHKGPGGGTYGDIEYDYTNLSGITTTIRYFRPTYDSIDIAVQVRPAKGYTSENLDTIKANLESYLANLNIGSDVTMTGTLKAIGDSVGNVSNPTFLLAGVSIGKTGDTMGLTDIEIPFNHVAEVGNVTVEAVV